MEGKMGQTQLLDLEGCPGIAEGELAIREIDAVREARAEGLDMIIEMYVPVAHSGMIDFNG
jgi:hypothetical protein